MTRRINLWSSPRNLSTALMYSWRQRSDTTVVDEPLYAHYLATSGVQHPGRERVLATQSSDGLKVIESIILGSYDTPVVFFKQMAKHLMGIDPAVQVNRLLSRCDNVLLTRDPFDMLTSFQVHVPDATVAETGFPDLMNILEHIIETDAEPIVIDSKLLLMDPVAVLGELCARLRLSFDPAMLSWPPGPKPEDGAWAPHCYRRVWDSTGFARWQPKDATLLPNLQPVLDEIEPLYRRLLPYCIGGVDL